MISQKMKPATVDEYLLSLPEPARSRARALRSILLEVVPEAEEMLKWGKPVCSLGTILFAYAAYQNHLTFIPTGPSLHPFMDQLSGFTVKKDSLQFLHDQPLPADLIRSIASYRVEDVQKRGAKWKYGG